MKSILSVSLCAGGLGALAAAGALAAPPIQYLRVVRQAIPAYPQEALIRGLYDGKAEVAFSVDPAGRLEDCLAVSYSDPIFGETAVDAVRRWKFAPATYDGQPVGATARMDFTFTSQGAVLVSLNASEETAAWIEKLSGKDRSFRAWDLSDLDRIPRPVRTVQPLYNIDFPTAGPIREVRVQFYIDPKGVVRLPCVAGSTDPRLSALAIEALRQWRFEPPTRGGRPVLARATQPFRFRLGTSPSA